MDLQSDTFVILTSSRPERPSRPVGQLSACLRAKRPLCTGERRRGRWSPMRLGFTLPRHWVAPGVVFHLTAPDQASSTQKRKSESLPPSPWGCGGRAPTLEARTLTPQGLGLLGCPACGCPCATPYAEPSVLPFCFGKRDTTVRVFPGGAQKAR